MSPIEKRQDGIGEIAGAPNTTRIGEQPIGLAQAIAAILKAQQSGGDNGMLAKIAAVLKASEEKNKPSVGMLDEINPEPMPQIGYNIEPPSMPVYAPEPVPSYPSDPMIGRPVEPMPQYPVDTMPSYPGQPSVANPEDDRARRDRESMERQMAAEQSYWRMVNQNRGGDSGIGSLAPQPPSLPPQTPVPPAAQNSGAAYDQLMQSMGYI